MNLQLKLFSGEEYKHNIEADIVTVGRSSKCDVVIPFVGVSRQHFQIEVKEGEIFITDLGSTNGVFIDGEKIEPHRKTPYKTFLNLSFGYVQSMHIDFQAANSETEAMNSLDNFTITRSLKNTPTVSMDAKGNTTRSKKDSTKNKKAPPTKAENNIAFGNLVALLIIVLAVLWYSMKEEEPVPSYSPGANKSAVKDFEQF